MAAGVAVAAPCAVSGEFLTQRVSLISRRRFADFDLSFEWRLLAGGNSGVPRLPETSCGERASSTG